MKFTATNKPNEEFDLFIEAPTKRDIPEPIAEQYQGAKTLKAVRTLGMLPQAFVFGGGFKEAKTALQIRRVYGSAAKYMASKEKIHWALKKISDTQLRSALIGMHQGAYSFQRYKSKKQPTLEEVQISNLPRTQQKILNEATIMAESVELCRDLVNTPAEDMGPDQFVAAAKAATRGTGLKLKVLSESECKKMKMGALLAVGRSSHRRPRMLTLEWSGASRKSFLALCGKGVCFDTGGLDIKPASGMLLMRKDMGGAATTLATMVALAKLKAKTKVRAYIPLVENAIGPDSFRPGDVLTAMDGQTIEVGHTDAEGRLILADAIGLARKEGASHIVSVATLTGAAMIALGRIHVPIMGDKKLVSALERGAKSSGEKVWELPLDEEHKNLVRGKWADLTNSDGSGEAGCITAGAFLSHFAGDIPFAHCDISPASWKSAPHSLGPAGATGALVTTLIDAFRSWKS